MKIVMHCVYYPPEVGGLESHVHFLCRALVEAGHEVDVVTSRSMVATPTRETVDGVRVTRTWFPGKHTLGWLAHAIGSTPAARRLARDADILHAQAFQSIPPLHAARMGRDIPLVATWHTSHFLKLAERSAWRPVLRRMVRTADSNLAASTEIARVAERLAPGTRVEAVTNGVETAVFCRVEPILAPPPAGRRRLLVPRRLFEKNGVEFLVRAIPLMLPRVDVEAVLVGDGPERERLESLARELEVADRVHFLGTKTHSEMPGLLSSGDLAIFPSLMEATSVAALEAMACELPVVATRVGGLPEIVDGSVGALCDPASPESLADAVVKLLLHGDLDALGHTARERVVERWSNARLARRHLEIYRDLAGGTH